jgi:hypothetical protein
VGTYCLGLGDSIRFSADHAGLPVQQLKTLGLDADDRRDANLVNFPVISLEPEPLKRWAKVTVGVPDVRVSGISIDRTQVSLRPAEDSTKQDDAPPPR